MSTDTRSIFDLVCDVGDQIEKVGEFLNTLTMQYELRYKW